LEFHRDSRRHTDGETQGENLDPEMGHAPIELIVGLLVLGHDPYDEPGESNRDRGEDEVETNRESELKSGE
jgi:hypothetical protein